MVKLLQVNYYLQQRCLQLTCSWREHQTPGQALGPSRPGREPGSVLKLGDHGMLSNSLMPLFSICKMSMTVIAPLLWIVVRFNVGSSTQDRTWHTVTVSPSWLPVLINYYYYYYYLMEQELSIIEILIVIKLIFSFNTIQWDFLS